MKKIGKQCVKAVLVLICVLMVSGCESVLNRNAPNQIVTFQGVTFSIPAYYDYRDPTSTETFLHYYPQQENCSSSLIFLGEQSTFTSADFEAAKNGFDDGIGTMFGEATLIKAEDVTVATLSGRRMSYTLEENGLVSTFQACVIYNTYNGAVIMLMQGHDSKDKSNFDYDGDFIKILETAQLANSNGSENISNIPSESGGTSTGEMLGSGDLGDYHVEIKSGALAKDYNGNPAIVITYAWTNNSDETTSAMVSISEKAFQNGVELDRAIIMDSSVYDSGAQMKDVRPGTTIDIQCAFLLDSQSSDIEIELSEWLGFSDEKVIKTYTLN